MSSSLKEIQERIASGVKTSMTKVISCYGMSKVSYKIIIIIIMKIKILFSYFSFYL